MKHGDIVKHRLDSRMMIVLRVVQGFALCEFFSQGEYIRDWFDLFVLEKTVPTVITKTGYEK